MPILNINAEFAGQVAVYPRLISINTNDTLAEVTTSGYLNKVVSSGLNLSGHEMALVYTTNGCNGGPGPNFFQVAITGSAQPYTYSLVEMTSY